MSGMGTLYVVATPIGNLRDITLRAIDVLKMVDFIVCEDTRISSKLLNKYDIKKKLIAVNEFNEEQIAYDVFKKLEAGNVALISDAGTPVISDPGYRIVSEAKKRGFLVTPIPGPNAAITALSASGLPTDKFVYLGFLPKTENKSLKVLESVRNVHSTIVIYESPHRLVATISNIQTMFGDIEITLARELTKVYEEIVAKKASEFVDYYKTKPAKGEFVLLFSAKP